MRYVVASNFNNNNICFINTSSRSIISKQASIDTQSIRAMSGCENELYYCDANNDTVYNFNCKSNIVKRIEKCIGKYPVAIKKWHEYLIIACSDTDTVESLSLNGHQARITLKLGSLLSDICIIDDHCYALCRLSCELYIISLPNLEILSIVNLDFNPNAFYIYDNEILLLGSKENCGLVSKVDKDGSAVYLSQTPYNPFDAVYYNGNIVVSCPGDDMLAYLCPKDLKIKYCVKLKNSPGKLFCYNDVLFLHLYFLTKILLIDEKNGKEIRTLPIDSELTDITTIEM